MPLKHLRDSKQHLAVSGDETRKMIPRFALAAGGAINTTFYSVLDNNTSAVEAIDHDLETAIEFLFVIFPCTIFKFILHVFRTSLGILGRILSALIGTVSYTLQIVLTALWQLFKITAAIICYLCVLYLLTDSKFVAILIFMAIYHLAKRLRRTPQYFPDHTNHAKHQDVRYFMDGAGWNYMNQGGTVAFWEAGRPMYATFDSERGFYRMGTTRAILLGSRPPPIRSAIAEESANARKNYSLSMSTTPATSTLPATSTVPATNTFPSTPPATSTSPTTTIPPITNTVPLPNTEPRTGILPTTNISPRTSTPPPPSTFSTTTTPPPRSTSATASTSPTTTPTTNTSPPTSTLSPKSIFPPASTTPDASISSPSSTSPAVNTTPTTNTTPPPTTFPITITVPIKSAIPTRRVVQRSLDDT